MATKRISQLPAADAGNVDLTVIIPALDANGDNVKATLEQLRAALGNITLDGDAAGAGLHGATITLTIANGVVTYAKLQNMSTNRLLGRSTAGAGSPEEIQIGAGLSLAGGVLTAAAPAAAAPSATLLTHRAFGGL